MSPRDMTAGDLRWKEAGLILLLAATTLAGADSDAQTSQNLYRAREFSLDAFGTASIGRYTIDQLSGSRIRQEATLGAGIGMSYFVTRSFGVGADVYSENGESSLVDNAAVNLIWRFPVGEGGFAPNLQLGGGRQFAATDAWFVQAGAGVEYRFTPYVGLYIDGRWVLPDKTQGFGVARLGMRFTF